MDGPMRPYLPELTIRDYNIYQWYLRGVQYQLNTTYGLYSCSLLQHNGVLFALLSDSLAGREATCKKVRLPWTLCWRPMMCQTQGIRLAAQADLAMAFYTPCSKSRPQGFVQALAVLREECEGERLVCFARNVSRPDESLQVHALNDVQPDMADMRTVVIVGNRMTRRVGQHVYTPRTHDGLPDEMYAASTAGK